MGADSQQAPSIAARDQEASVLDEEEGSLIAREKGGDAVHQTHRGRSTGCSPDSELAGGIAIRLPWPPGWIRKGLLKGAFGRKTRRRIRPGECLTPCLSHFPPDGQHRRCRIHSKARPRSERLHRRSRPRPFRDKRGYLPRSRGRLFRAPVWLLQAQSEHGLVRRAFVADDQPSRHDVRFSLRIPNFRQEAEDSISTSDAVERAFIGSTRHGYALAGQRRTTRDGTASGPDSLGEVSGSFGSRRPNCLGTGFPKACRRGRRG